MMERIDMRVIGGVRYRPEDALRIRPAAPATAAPAGPEPTAAKTARKGKTA